VERAVTRAGEIPSEGVAYALRAVGLSKTYGTARVLDGVDLEVKPGEIHALLGGNGSGKSTLIKVLAGVVDADGGTIDVFGDTVDARDQTPGRSREQGFRFVHQTGGFFSDMTVADNLALGQGFPTVARHRIDGRKLRARSQKVLHGFEIDIDPGAKMGSLRVADRMMVAIARALQAEDENSRAILVLDEPTAALPEHEVDLLLSAVRRYASAGHAIIYVTHRLDEVFDLADELTVLRDGVSILTESVSKVTMPRLVETIAGMPVDAASSPPAPPSSQRTALRVEHLEVPPLRDVSFAVAPGEIVGVAGLLGSGRSELLRALFGALPFKGTVRLAGEPFAPSSPRHAMRRGVGFVAEDRVADSAFLDRPVSENASAASISSYWRRGVLDRRRERRDARKSIEDLGIRAPSERAPLAALSGGNQQKVILARWLRRAPKLLLLDEPTHGVDVGARADIHDEVRRLAAKGASVLIVSSDFEELAELAERVIVLHGGVVAEELVGHEISAHRLTVAAYRSDDETTSAGQDH